MSTRIPLPSPGFDDLGVEERLKYFRIVLPYARGDVVGTSCFASDLWSSTPVQFVRPIMEALSYSGSSAIIYSAEAGLLAHQAIRFEAPTEGVQKVPEQGGIHTCFEVTIRDQYALVRREKMTAAVILMLAHRKKRLLRRAGPRPSRPLL